MSQKHCNDGYLNRFGLTGGEEGARRAPAANMPRSRRSVYQEVERAARVVQNSISSCSRITKLHGYSNGATGSSLLKSAPNYRKTSLESGSSKTFHIDSKRFCKESYPTIMGEQDWQEPEPRFLYCNLPGLAGDSNTKRKNDVVTPAERMPRKVKSSQDTDSSKRTLRRETISSTAKNSLSSTSKEEDVTTTNKSSKKHLKNQSTTKNDNFPEEFFATTDEITRKIFSSDNDMEKRAKNLGLLKSKSTTMGLSFPSLPIEDSFLETSISDRVLIRQQQAIWNEIETEEATNEIFFTNSNKTILSSSGDLAKIRNNSKQQQHKGGNGPPLMKDNSCVCRDPVVIYSGRNNVDSLQPADCCRLEEPNVTTDEPFLLRTASGAVFDPRDPATVQGQMEIMAQIFQHQRVKHFGDSYNEEPSVVDHCYRTGTTAASRPAARKQQQGIESVSSVSRISLLEEECDELEKKMELSFTLLEHATRDLSFEPRKTEAREVPNVKSKIAVAADIKQLQPKQNLVELCRKNDTDESGRHFLGEPKEQRKCEEREEYLIKKKIAAGNLVTMSQENQSKNDASNNVISKEGFRKRFNRFEDNIIEMYPGKKLLLRGESHVWKAIAKGNAIIVKCAECGAVLQIPRDAKIVYCSTCGTISPTDIELDETTSKKNNPKARSKSDSMIAQVMQRNEYQVAIAKKWDTYERLQGLNAEMSPRKDASRKSSHNKGTGTLDLHTQDLA